VARGIAAENRVAQELHRLGEAWLGSNERTDVTVQVGQVVERSTEPQRVTEPSPNLNLLRQYVDTPLRVARRPENAAVAVESPRSNRVRQLGVRLEQFGTPLQTLAVLARGVPQVAETFDETGSEDRLILIEGETESRAEAALFTVEIRKRVREVAAPVHHLQLPGNIGEVGGVAAVDRLTFTDRVELATRVFTNGFEQVVAGRVIVTEFGGDHRLVD
jgi:hypothetical protein